MITYPHTAIHEEAGQIPEIHRALAEDANAFVPMASGLRYHGEGFVLRIGDSPPPQFNVVCRVRLRADQIDAAIEDVRRQLTPLGHRASWEVGSSSTPSDLEELLLARGFEPDEEEPAAAAMVLVSPPHCTADIKVRRALSPVERAAASDVLAQVWRGEPPFSPAQREEAVARWAQRPPSPEDRPTYVAWLEDTPIAAGSASFCGAGVFMAGTGTLPAYRGRGAYRALVAARWRDAVARGTPVLATAAGRMSQPILAQLGFITVAELRFYNDAAADVPPA